MLALMRARFCTDASLTRLFSTGHHDCAVCVQQLGGEAPPRKLRYNGVLGSCIALTEDASEVLVGTRDGLVVGWELA